MEDKLRTAYRRCRTETRHEATNFYWAFITLPHPKRAAIYAVYSLFRRWDDIADSELPLEEKRQALEEQKKLLLDLYRAHVEDDFVLLAVGDVIRRYGVPRRYFEEVLAGIELDLRKRRYQTFEELKKYCYGVASAVGLISLEIFGYHGPEAKEHAIDLGIAMQLTNILRDIKEDLERDRIYLPQEDLERFGYSEGELQQGIANDSFCKLMQFEIARAREYFAQGRQLLKYLPLRSRPCPAILAGLYQQILGRIEAHDYNVFAGRIGLSPREKLSTMLWASTRGLLAFP